MTQLINIKLKINIESGLSNLDFSKLELVNAHNVKLVLIDAPEETLSNENEQWIELQGIDTGVVYEDVRITSDDLESDFELGNINLGTLSENENTQIELVEETPKFVSNFVNIKLKVDIEGGKANVDFSKMSLHNAGNIHLVLINAPEGHNETETSQWIELQNIDRNTVYKDVQIISEDFDEPLNLGDISFPAQTTAETKIQSERTPGKAPKIIGEVQEDVQDELDEEHEITTEIAFSKLEIAEANTSRLEGELEIATKKLDEVNEIVDEKQSKIDLINSELIAFNNHVRESQATYDASIAKANEEGTSEEAKSKLMEDARAEEMTLESLRNQIANKEEMLAMANEDIAPHLEKQSISESEVKALNKEVLASRKIEEDLKVFILHVASKKTAKAKKANKKIEKFEDHAYVWRNEIEEIQKEISELEAKISKYNSQIEEFKNDAANAPIEDERVLLEAEASKVHSVKMIAEGDLRKLEKRIQSLDNKATKAEAKAMKATNKARLLNRDAHEANETAMKIRGLRISELEKQADAPELTQNERDSLTQEIEALKIEQTKILARESEDELTHEVKVVTNSKMKFAEKYVKARFKKTYWIIYERGSRSRDHEIHELELQQEQERNELLLEVDRRKAEAKAQLVADKERAAQEIEAIKNAAATEAEKLQNQSAEETARAQAELDNARAEGERILAEQKAEIERMKAESEAEKLAVQKEAEEAREAARAEAAEAKAQAEKEAAEAKAAAEAEVEKAKAEGERILAEQKEEIEAKVHQAEKMIEEDKARHDEIENGLREKISELEKENKHAEDEIHKLSETLHAEAVAREKETKAREELIAQFNDHKGHHEATVSNYEKAIEEHKALHEDKVTQVKNEHESQLSELDKAVEEAKASAEEARIAADAQVAELRQEADAALAKIKEEHENNNDELLRRIKELEENLDKTLKAKAISDKKAELLSQIESLVEEDIKN